jgi:hypothetical protein
MDKIPTFFKQAEEDFGFKILYGDEIKMHHLKKLKCKLCKIKKDENIVFVSGIGKRKSPLQKLWNSWMNTYQGSRNIISIWILWEIEIAIQRQTMMQPS